MNSGASLLGLATGLPAGRDQAGERSLEDVLRIGPEQTKATILAGLRALHDWQERNDTR